MIDCPINNKKRLNVYPYMALCWDSALAVVPSLGQFLFFVGWHLNIAVTKPPLKKTHSETNWKIKSYLK